MSEATQAAELRARRPREDWFDESYVSYWIDEQEIRSRERQRQFVRIRALLPKDENEEFRYINIGAGPGHLDELLLDRFRGAHATLVDGAPGMLTAAAKRLERFENRVECVEANLSGPEWIESLSGPFDVAVSSIAIHNLRQPARIRQVYGEICSLLNPGGMFLNLDYVRLGRAALASLAPWAARDPDAEFNWARGGAGGPGTVEEQLGWLREAGFACAECFWREWQVALLAGFREPIEIPAL